jgi:hypothetical protein
MGKCFERTNKVERLLRELFVGDTLIFTKKRLLLIVAHPGDSNFAKDCSKPERNLVPNHFYRFTGKMGPDVKISLRLFSFVTLIKLSPLAS